MKTITITFIMDNKTFLWIWGIANKEADRKGGLGFNEFLVDYYINEIAEKFPDVDEVIPRIFGVTESIKYLIEGGGTPDRYVSFEYAAFKQDNLYNELKRKFIVEKKDIINPIEVGI